MYHHSQSFSSSRVFLCPFPTAFFSRKNSAESFIFQCFQRFQRCLSIWQRAWDSNPRGLRPTRVPGELLSHSVNPLYLHRLIMRPLLLYPNIRFLQVENRYFFNLFLTPKCKAFYHLNALKHFSLFKQIRCAIIILCPFGRL